MDFNSILCVVFLQITLILCQEDINSSEAGKTSKLLSEKACKNDFTLQLISNFEIKQYNFYSIQMLNYFKSDEKRAKIYCKSFEMKVLTSVNTNCWKGPMKNF